MEYKLLQMLATTLGMVWGHCSYLSGLLSTQLGHLCLLGGLTHSLIPFPPTCHLINGTHDVAGLVQSYFKKKQIQLTLYYLSTMVAVALFHSYSKFYMVTIKHRIATYSCLNVSNINEKCDNLVGFPKSGHKLYYYTIIKYGST